MIKHVISVSGGKDSLATLLIAIERFDLIEPTACASAYGLCDQWQPEQQQEARAAV